MRHLAIGGGVIKELDELRGPMSDILDELTAQRKELERYKKRYGKLPSPESSDDDEDDYDTDEGSDTEQES
jgi:adenylate cyclase